MAGQIVHRTSKASTTADNYDKCLVLFFPSCK